MARIAFSGQFLGRAFAFGNDDWEWGPETFLPAGSRRAGAEQRRLRDERSFRFDIHMHMREECPREHVYTATRPLLLVARPFVGGPQDDCVTSRAEVARPRVGRQRSRPVGCVEQ